MNKKNESSNSLYNRPNYTCIHQVRNACKGGSVCIYDHNSIVFTKKENLSMNCDNLEAPIVKIDNAKDKECNC